MRWEALFADLEGQLAAEQRRERDDEVAERTRRERALVTLPARLAAAVGAPVRISLVGGLQVDGDLRGPGGGLGARADDRRRPRGARAARGRGGPALARVPLDAGTRRPAVRARLCPAGAVARPRHRGHLVGRRRPAAAGDHRCRRGRPPRPRRAPRRGFPAAGRTSGPWRRCRSRRSWPSSHDADAVGARAQGVGRARGGYRSESGMSESASRHPGQNEGWLVVGPVPSNEPLATPALPTERVRCRGGRPRPTGRTGS